MFIVAALVSMSFIIDADTSVWTLVPFMVLLGLGLGFNFQPVILAVQNAVRPQRDGRGDLVGDVLPADGRHDRRRGLPVHPVHHAARQDQRRLRPTRRTRRPAGGRRSADRRPAQGGSATVRHVVRPEAAAAARGTPFKTGFSDSIDLVFLVAAAVVAIGFFVMLFLPELPLRNQSGIQAQQSGAGEITARAPRSTPEVEADQPTQSVGASAPTSTPPPAGTAEDPRH